MHYLPLVGTLERRTEASRTLLGATKVQSVVRGWLPRAPGRAQAPRRGGEDPEPDARPATPTTTTTGQHRRECAASLLELVIFDAYKALSLIACIGLP